jgi:ribosomal protein S5
MDDYDGIYPIYKSNNGVYLSVCGDKQGRVGAGQGRAGRPGQPLRGATQGAISIKEILGENRGTCI